MNFSRALALASALLALPGVSAAQQFLAYTTNTVLMRAGPAPEYPVVAVLHNGYTIAVQGCLQDYSWCDVVAGPNRGWVHARYIAYPYQETTFPVIEYGPAIGIGVVSFIIGSYWHEHYIARPWYGQLRHWIHRPPKPEGRAVPIRRFHHRPPVQTVHVRPRHKVVVPVAVRQMPGPRPPLPRAAAYPRPLQMGIGPRRPPVGAGRDAVSVSGVQGHSLTLGVSSGGARMGARVTGVRRVNRP